MADLLSYTGDAALGLGSNPGVPAIDPKSNLDVINGTTRDVMLLDNERNLKIFQQKVNDRDKLTNMIMDDKVATGDILPKYQDPFDAAKKRVEDTFFKWKGNFNDTRGFNAYKESVQHLKDVATHAQTSTVEIKKLQQQAATEPLPRKKAEMAKWIEDQANQDFWNPVVPFQQLHDLNMDTFGKFVQPVTSVVTPDPSKPFMSFDESRIDFGDIRRKTLNGYINDLDQANDIEQLLTKFQGYNQPGLNKALSAMDGQIDQYNLVNGYGQGDPKYVPPIKTAKDANGNTLIAEPQVDFAAKYALANQAKYLTRTPKFSKDLANYDLGLKKLDLAARKLGLEGEKARAYVRNLDAKTNKFYSENKDEATNVIRQYNDFVDNVNPAGIATKTPEGKTGRMDAVFLDDLPGGYQLINGPMIGMKNTTVKKKDGTVTITSIPTGKVEVGQLQPFISTDKGHHPYYIPSYVNPSTGTKMDLQSDELKGSYQKSKKNYPGLSYEEYIRALLKKGAIELVLKGQNGAANFTSMSQSAKLINAATSKKGRENTVNPPEQVSDAEQDLNTDTEEP